TFTDRLCGVAARLQAGITGASGPLPPWGHKDVQRRLLRDAGVSRVRSARVDGPDALRAFVASAGLPVVVKPVGGAASQDTWLLGGEPDLGEFLQRAGDRPPGQDMFAEQFITGEPAPAPHLADYVSAEIFRCGPATGAAVGSAAGPVTGSVAGLATGSVSGRATDLAVRAFVTDRLVPAWPCRETGLVLPSARTADRQEAVIATAQRALDALGAADGVFHVELKPARPAPEIIEVNGRLGGFIARLVGYGTGQDLGRAALNCALGRLPDLDLRWGRCVLVLLFQPPARAVGIIRAPSRRELARRPGVLAGDQLHAAGTSVDWRRGTNFPAAMLWLAGDGHDELRARLLDVAAFLTEEFAFAGPDGRTLSDSAWLDLITD
ncbi:MAG: ATP-grasp domain-containing protein, partial [Actinoallomurus sp.]